MKPRKQILFVQLPLISHSHDYLQGNVEYASAALAGYIERHITGDVIFHHLPPVITQFGSDSVILNYIADREPDIVAFTCFLWNIERSLSIARRIKEHNNSVQIIIGGSEIFPGSIALAARREYVDYFAVGEGEWFFKRYFSASLEGYETLVNGNHVVTQPADQLIPVDNIVEPLSCGLLGPMPDGSAFFELTRGCPYKCSYCLYSKNFNSIREQPFDRLLNVLTDRNITRTMNELYILSPALNCTKKFVEKLENLAAVNPGIRLHSEMRAGGIDAGLARLLYRAGFRSMEVGLQTTNMESLNRVGRNSRPHGEIDGMRHLLDAGIDIKIGLMPGLPGDTKDSFIRMTDMLIRSGFNEYIELYPLMILPGTLIRDQADAGGINYLKKPPYYYNYGWGTSFDDLRDITRYVEDATGLSHIVRKLPDFTMHEQGSLCRGLFITSDAFLDWKEAHLDCIETSVFDYHIQVRDEAAVYKCISTLIQHVPDHLLFHMILYTNGILDEHRILDIMQELPDDNFFRRINIFHDWKDGCRIRLYQVIDRHEEYAMAQQSYSFVTPIFHVTEANFHSIEKIHDYEDNVLIARGMFGAIQKYCKKFIDAVESIAFEEESEQEEFYRLSGYDYIRMPHTFKIKTV